MMKSVEGSRAPSGPMSAPHQSATSADPVSAWHTSTALSRVGASVPHVWYATVTRGSTAPDSTVKGAGSTCC